MKEIGNSPCVDADWQAIQNARKLKKLIWLALVPLVGGLLAAVAVTGVKGKDSNSKGGEMPVPTGSHQFSDEGLPSQQSLENPVIFAERSEEVKTLEGVLGWMQKSNDWYLVGRGDLLKRMDENGFLVTNKGPDLVPNVKLGVSSDLKEGSYFYVDIPEGFLDKLASGEIGVADVAAHLLVQSAVLQKAVETGDKAGFYKNQKQIEQAVWGEVIAWTVGSLGPHLQSPQLLKSYADWKKANLH